MADPKKKMQDMGQKAGDMKDKAEDKLRDIKPGKKKK
jgi:hypothetical protein